MPDGSTSFGLVTQARIGPNAILQLAEPMQRLLGPGALTKALTQAGVSLPDGSDMVPEQNVARVHDALWHLFPDQARVVSEQAGQGTARYIRDNRIPKTARMVLRLLPKLVAERLLTRAIAQHAWTFCGSGSLNVRHKGRCIHFILKHNPLADWHASPGHPCLWQRAVFAELFSTVLGGRYHCDEVSCSGCGGAVCRFVLYAEGVG